MQALEGTYAGIFHFLEWTEQIKNACGKSENSPTGSP
jgi:hypothetical protein